MTGLSTGPGQQVFHEHRKLLFSVAYRVLGTAADAEDTVQDAWLKWSAADRSQVADPKAYLTRIVSNLALERLRSTRYKRETYVGPWLPEPILTSGDAVDDTAEAVTDTESVSMAMLVVLETLSPLERAVFVLKEVFGFSHAEIAEAVERSDQQVRPPTRSAPPPRPPRHDESACVPPPAAPRSLPAAPPRSPPRWTGPSPRVCGPRGRGRSVT